MNAPLRLDTVTVRVCVDPARGLWRTEHIHAGQSLASLCDGLELPHEGLRELLSVRVGEWAVPRERWPHVRPRAGALVIFQPQIGGPALGAIFAGISGIAKAGGALFGAKATLGGFLKAGVGKLLGGLVSIGASLALQGLRGAPGADADAPKSIGFAGAQNDFEPGAYFKLWMGEFKDAPQVTVPVFTEIDGDDQFATIGLTAVGLFTEPVLSAGDVDLATVQDREVVIWEASSGETPPSEVTDLIDGTKIERIVDIEMTGWETDPDETEDGPTPLDGTIEETEPLWHDVESLKDVDFLRIELIADSLYHTNGNAIGIPIRFQLALRNGGVFGGWIDGPVLILRGKEPGRPVRVQLYIHRVDSYPAEVGNDWPGAGAGEAFTKVAGWGHAYSDAEFPTSLLTVSGDGYAEWWWESEQKIHLYLLNSAYPGDRLKVRFKRSWPFTWSWYNPATHAIDNGVTPGTTTDLFSPWPADNVPGNPRNFYDSLSLKSVQNYWPEFPIAPRGNPKTHIFIRVRNQEIGTIKALWTRLIPAWNGSTWAADQASSNPGALYRDILKGMHNAKLVPDALIDGASMIDLYEWCDVAGKECRMTLPGGGSVEEALKAVALTAHGRPIKAPIHRVEIDRIREGGAVGLITSRSAAGFSFEKLFKEKPHALDVTFTSAADNYETRSVRVYAQGYNADGSGGLIAATRFQSISYPGIVSENEAILRAELDLAWIWFRDRPIYCTQALLAREHEVGNLVLVETEILGRVSGRGRIKSGTVSSGGGDGLRDIADLREVHDLRTVGIGPATYTAIVIDEVPFFGDASFDLRSAPDLRAVADLRAPAARGVAIRQRNGDVAVIEVESFSTETKEIVFATPTALDIREGDEVATGPFGLEARKMLVWNMVPRGRGLTQLMLIDYREDDMYLGGGLPVDNELIIDDGELVVDAGQYVYDEAA